MRILVVEDYGPLRQSITQAFRESGFAVDDTAEGREGLRYAQSNEYDAVVSDIAHELRTPLAGLRSSVEVALSRSRDTAEYVEVLATCRSIGLRMQGIVENLLALARLEAGHVTCRSEPTCVQHLLQESWALQEKRAAERRVELEWDVNDKLLVRSDPDQLRVVFRNLLENATEHNHCGGHIKVRAAQDNGTVCVSISNSHDGLRAEDLPHLFERFWIADVTRHANETRCGLGLALCREIMEHLGGDITARLPVDGHFMIEVTVAAD
jgi:two-component system sensor histidine kinase BaeS